MEELCVVIYRINRRHNIDFTLEISLHINSLLKAAAENVSENANREISRGWEELTHIWRKIQIVERGLSFGWQ